jgi:hypothetical protein
MSIYMNFKKHRECVHAFNLPCHGLRPEVIDKESTSAVRHVGQEGKNFCQQVTVGEDLLLVCGRGRSSHDTGGARECGGL